MSQLLINGSNRLCGDVDIHGAKNSALPILAACLTAHGETVLHNCPNLSDVESAMQILSTLGCKCKREGHDVTVDSSNVNCCAVPAELMHKMRSSIIFLGALMSRCGCADLSLPGGCELGPRPINLHIDALRRMGVDIEEREGTLICKCDELHGEKIYLEKPSVGATENIMLAAVKARGETVIHNAACEPEIADLAAFLNGCGAKIRGAGESVVVIEGVDELHCSEHEIIPDRIEAATYLCAAAITGGELRLNKTDCSHYSAVIEALNAAGCKTRIYDGDKRMTLLSPERLNGIGKIRTDVYPDFPTDALSPFLALMSKSRGETDFTETVFQNRFSQVPQLNKMGADIIVSGNTARVIGKDKLYGAQVYATDLRGGAALIVAALGAQGETEISQIQHIDRGYEDICGSLSELGADIKRI